MFKIGDKAVYPVHGVGEIKAIETKIFSGSETTFFIMKIYDSDMKIMIPIRSASSVGLRKITPQIEVENIYHILKTERKAVAHLPWNRRQKLYSEKLKKGTLFDVAEVFRDLSNIKQEKDLSFGERKMLDTAKNLLVKEMSVSKGVSEDKVVEDLNRILNFQ